MGAQLQKNFLTPQYAMREFYGYFFDNIMRTQKQIAIAVSDIDLVYPFVLKSNTRKVGMKEARDWAEANFVTLLRAQLLKNSDIK